MILKFYGGPDDGLEINSDPYPLVGSKTIEIKKAHPLRTPVYKLSFTKEKAMFSHYKDEEQHESNI